MKYGKLFKKYIERYGETPDSNKCSSCSRTTLLHMAHNMYPENKNLLESYMRTNTKDLSRNVYHALKNL